MGDISIKGRSPILRQGFATGGAVRHIRKSMKKLGEAAKQHVARKEAAKVQAGKGGKKSYLDKDTERMTKHRPLHESEYIIAHGGEGFKKGGKAKKDKKWIQKATASIKRRKTKGKCTPITKKGCTGRAKALAKTFKKMAKKRKAA